MPKTVNNYFQCLYNVIAFERCWFAIWHAESQLTCIPVRNILRSNVSWHARAK